MTMTLFENGRMQLRSLRLSLALEAADLDDEPLLDCLTEEERREVAIEYLRETEGDGIG
jgi:hypothetical protein